MEVNGKIFISSKHTVNEYRKLDLKVNSDREIWYEAIEIFIDRINSRFIEPINYLLKVANSTYNDFPKSQFEFSALAIISLLIETLQQFKDGKINNDGEVSVNYKNFLEQELKFTEQEAKVFYKNIRCGLLHQGEILDKTVIVPYEKSYNDIYNDPFIQKNKLNTKILFKKIIRYFKNYIDLLSDSRNKTYRENFIKKMNSIIDKIR